MYQQVKKFLYVLIFIFGSPNVLFALHSIQWFKRLESYIACYPQKLLSCNKRLLNNPCLALDEIIDFIIFLIGMSI